MDQTKQFQIATLGAGCFWCVEAVFDELRGVESVESGYSGGVTANPTYAQVCSGRTGHAEVAQITFDPNVISFAQRLVDEIDAAKIWDRPIVTEVTPFKEFYKAEGYHQEYYVNNPGQPYCQVVIAPKVNKFRKKFKEKLKT